MLDAIEFLGKVFPLFIRLVTALVAAGKDPEAELLAMIAAADLAADTAEKNKFSGV